jgi:hypothetical protein
VPVGLAGLRPQGIPVATAAELAAALAAAVAVAAQL